MPVAAVLHPLALLVAASGDRSPEDNDVVAGGWGALVFVLLILAVAVLAFSLVKQLRKAQAAKDAGVFGDGAPPDDVEPAGPAETAEPDNHSPH
jgi:hypothetical protein